MATKRDYYETLGVPRTASADEKPELWRIMTSAWPAYDDYQRNTERDIPVVVLERSQ